MTLVQLEYIVALEKYRHFGKAAEACFVTQPSLSAQIKKLEDEIGAAIFMRSKLPVTLTETGELIVTHAKQVLSKVEVLKHIVPEQNNSLKGNLKIGIIPTLAPYLLPLFIKDFIDTYPDIRLSIREMRTEDIINEIKNGNTDIGLMATPLNDGALKEDILFTEPFIAYINKNEKLYNKKFILPKDINPDRMWLAEEGHCIRNQVLNLCELQKHSSYENHLDYETGSIETLKRFVEKNEGITLLPQLATLDMNEEKLNMLRYFKEPAPAREISIVTRHNFIKTRITKLLKASICNNLPAEITASTKRKVLPVIL